MSWARTCPSASTCVPAQFRVIVTRRPKYACRACEEVVVQAPAPARLVEGGIPTEATVAHVLCRKYADHLPLYRQAQIYARQGVNLDRSTLADWVGKAAFLLRPVHERLFERLKASDKLFADETTAPVLDPGRGRTKTGQLFAYARDDRPWGGTDPPGVAYLYAPDRKAEQPMRHLQGFVGHPAGRRLCRLPGAGRAQRREPGLLLEPRPAQVLRTGPVRPGADRHARRSQRIAALYQIEGEIRGRSAEERRTVRQAEKPPASSRPSSPGCARSSRSSARRASSPKPSATRSRAGPASAASSTTAASRSTPNVVERSIRPIALNRKNALFAGSDGGGEHWATIASLVETAKLNGVDPHAYLADVITRIVAGHPQSQIDDLLPWAYAPAPLKAVA